ERRRAVEADAVARETAFHQRRVRVVEASQDGATPRVDDRRLRTAVPQDFSLGADLQNLVAANGDGVGDRAEVVGDIHARVVDDEIDRAAAVVALRPYAEP